MSVLAGGVGFIKDKAAAAAKNLAEGAKREKLLDAVAQPLREAARDIRVTASEGVTRARAAAADSIARGGAGAATKAGAAVAPDGHWTRRLSSFLDLEPQTRNVVMIGLAVAGVALIVMLARKR